MNRKITALLLIFILIPFSGCQPLENRKELLTYVSETVQTETMVSSEVPSVTTTEATTVTTMEATSVTTTKTTEETSEATYNEVVDIENIDERFSVSFVGDTTQSGLFGDNTDSSGMEYAFSDVKPIFDS